MRIWRETASGWDDTRCTNWPVLSHPNAGASAARNHALRLAQGDFIQFPTPTIC